MSEKVGSISRIYQYNGVELRYSTIADNRENESNFVGITENRNFAAFSSVLARLQGIPVYTAMASGFAKVWKMGTDMQFVISDHADFSQSLEYIEATGRETDIHLRAEQQASSQRTSRRRGYAAEPLPDHKRFG